MNKLYIGNLPADVNEGSIRELFHEHTGAVPKSVLVKKGGYAFVECADDETISKAIETLNGETANTSARGQPRVMGISRCHSLLAPFWAAKRRSHGLPRRGSSLQNGA